MKTLKVIKLFTFFVGLSLGLIACNNGSNKSKADQNPASKLSVVCTTGIIADAVQNIVGKQATVVALMGAGVDPHLYKASQGDLAKLVNADVIIHNGLHLEGKMSDVLDNLKGRKKVLAFADGLPPLKLINNTSFANAHDPHIWFDVDLWRQAMCVISAQLQAIDTANAKIYKQNTFIYNQKLIDLDQRTLNQIAQIPKNQRVLITAHDAFSYFGNRYQIEVRGLQGISTVSEFGLRDITNLVNFIVERRIRAVFVESSVPQKSLEAVVKGCNDKGFDVKIGGTLFSDAMGGNGTPEGTYIGMVRHNVNLIAQGLK